MCVCMCAMGVLRVCMCVFRGCVGVYGWRVSVRCAGVCELCTFLWSVCITCVVGGGVVYLCTILGVVRRTMMGSGTQIRLRERRPS